jgi:UDP-N-acetylglucosamine/UDP-N-acetylgalactosamine diphosphorylase
VAQLAAIDFKELARLFASRHSRDGVGRAGRASPPPALRLSEDFAPFSREAARRQGEAALAAGQVGALLVAGGEGTRLGFDRPKGTYPIGPVSAATLFQILLEKVLAAGRRHNASVPLYLMTSPTTHDATAAFLAEHRWFGLKESDVFLFCQGTMPALDGGTGQLLLESPGSLALSPDGHGGMLAAFARSGGLEDALRRGLRQLFYFQVDNPLVRVCDPEFLGCHLLGASELATQVVAKRSPWDKLGNVVVIDGAVQIIEYSEMSADAASRAAAAQSNPDGSLRLWAGNTAIHVLDVAFLERMAAQPDALPLHVAHKVVPYLGDDGEVIVPREANAVKFERFMFDLMPRAKGAVVMEIDPAEGFAPVKNAPGESADTPYTTQAALLADAYRRLTRAGAIIAPGARIEISPLLDSQPGALERFRGRELRGDVYLR